ncbi:Pentatricopeptide repeat-containing protein [Arachis hypogaea]|nr:Pentatricopeptide repeat-containing protein [Arachis hypogaea]
MSHHRSADVASFCQAGAELAHFQFIPTLVPRSWCYCTKLHSCMLYSPSFSHFSSHSSGSQFSSSVLSKPTSTSESAPRIRTSSISTRKMPRSSGSSNHAHLCIITTCALWFCSFLTHLCWYFSNGYLPETFLVSSTLLNMYVKFHLLEEAHKLFDEMPERNVVS